MHTVHNSKGSKEHVVNRISFLSLLLQKRLLLPLSRVSFQRYSTNQHILATHFFQGILKNLNQIMSLLYLKSLQWLTRVLNIGSNLLLPLTLASPYSSHTGLLYPSNAFSYYPLDFFALLMAPPPACYPGFESMQASLSHLAPALVRYFGIHPSSPPACSGLLPLTHTMPPTSLLPFQPSDSILVHLMPGAG